MSPTERNRLQQCCEAADIQVRQGNYDHAAELFQQCVIGDPQNILYVQRFLGTLKLKYRNNRRGDLLAPVQAIPGHRRVSDAAAKKDWEGVVKCGLDVLKLNPWDVPTLLAMATASEQLGGDAELVYLRFALETDPRSPEINRLCKEALAKRSSGR